MKKRSKGKNSSGISSTMAPGRVFAVDPERTKRMLEVEETGPTRVTRQKVKETTTNEKATLAAKERANLAAKERATLAAKERAAKENGIPATNGNWEHQTVDSFHPMDHGSPSLDEASTGHMQLSPISHNAGMDEEPEQPNNDEGKLFFYLFLFQINPNACILACLP